MSIQSILLLITASVNSLLSLFVLLGKRDKVNIVYSLFVLFASMWAVGLAYFILGHDLNASLLAANFYYVAAAGIPAFFLSFACIFLHKGKTRKDFVYAMAFLPVLMLTGLFVLDKHLIIADIFYTSSGKDVVLNKFNYLVYGIYFFLLVIFAYVKLFSTLRTAVDDEERKQLLFIIWGTSIGFIFGMIFNLILPFFGNYQLIFLGPLFSFSMVVSIAYSIGKYHLFDIKVIATQLLTFFLWIFLFVRTVISTSFQDQAINFSLFFVTVVLGSFLIKSVIKEVRQREQLEELSVKLEKANEKLKDLDQARADFITLTSHQLRTPPATLKWYLSAIRQGDYGQMDEGVKEMVVKAEITNNSLISLIEDLLNASRIERGKMEFLFEPGDLEELTRFTVEQLLPQARMKKLELSYTPPRKEVPKVLVDREKVRQVINNFIDNAIKYTLKGSISVWVEADDNNVYVKVKDTGKGVAKNIAPSLFTKYSRGKDAAIHSTGIGLGLFVAKIVIENHKGSIGVESEGEGKGSTFYFSLPIHNDLPHTKIMDLVKQNQDIEQVALQDKGGSK